MVRHIRTVKLAILVAAVTSIMISIDSTGRMETEKRNLSIGCKIPCSVTKSKGNVTVNCYNCKCHVVPPGLKSETTRLILTKNYYMKIKPNAFASLVNLVYLDLSCCKLGTIPSGCFDTLVRLKFLNLSYNTVNFPEGVFSRLINLEELHLTRTQSISTFKERFFINLTRLETLSFAGNQLKVFPQFLTNQSRKWLLPNLKHLNLARNDIQQIAKNDSIRLVHTMKILDLTGNRMYNIPDNFIKMTTLKRLVLDENPINQINCNAFQSSTLEYLSIAHCKFKPIPGKKCHVNMLHDISTLKTLNLAHSTGLRIAVYPLSSQNNLLELNLAETQLDEMSLRNFTVFLPNLRRFDVSGNDIKSLSAELWNNLSIKVLNLGRNSIATINVTSFPQTMWKSLNVVDVSGNPFYCECNLVWFRQWLRNTNVTLRHSSKTACAGPPDRKDLRISALTRPTALECFSVDTNWTLLMTFLLSLAIVMSTTITSVLYSQRWFIRYWLFKTKSKAKRLQELLDGTEYEFDAFVSYSESDNAWVVNTLCQMLENKFNLRLCLHHRDWMIGRDIVTNIIDSIEKSRKTLMVVSNAFSSSQWCHFEMTMAQTKLFEEDRDNLILVLLEEIAEINMNPRLQLQMQRKTYVEWTENPFGQQLFWGKLRQALTSSASSIVNETPPRELFVSQENI